MTAYDVAELIETATRRELALKGSLVTTRNPKAYVGPRPDAVSPLDRPEIRWPSERHLVPERCWNCGTGRLNFDIDAPYGLRKAGEVTCRSCSRVQVRLKADNTERAPLPPPTPEELTPRRGRPPKPVPPPAFVCVACGAPSRKRHCLACTNAERAKWPRLVALLADGLPMRAQDIKAALGISDESLRQFVHKARLAGHPIRSGLPFGTYRLEARP